MTNKCDVRFLDFYWGVGEEGAGCFLFVCSFALFCFSKSFLQTILSCGFYCDSCPLAQPLMATILSCFSALILLSLAGISYCTV